MKFPIVELPDYYSGLLKLNVPSIGRALEVIPPYIEKHPHLQFLIKKYFKDVNNQGHVNQILKSLGWANFRNRLCSLFIFRQANGAYPDVKISDYSTGVNSFEKKISRYSVNGFSRGFLSGHYLKMARIQTNSSEEFDFLNISREIMDILSCTKVRVIKIDWLLMLVIHFNYFLGHDVLKEEIGKDTKFRVLYNSLSEEEKSLLMDNMLAYGASIDESDTFAGKLV